MKVVDRFNVSKPPEGPRKFTFEFSGPGLVSVVVVAVLGIAWVFILGVLVGRGYKPEEAVPQVAQIMPAPAPAAQAESKEPPTVLKPEQLDFQDTLQGRKPPETVTVDSAKKAEEKPSAMPGGAATAPAGAPAAAVDNSTLATTPAPLPKGKVATAPAQPDKKTAKADPAPEKAQAGEAKKDSKDSKDSKEKKYRASYQLAAFDEKAQAQSEADRFAKKGLSTSVVEAQVKGKSMYRVMAQVKGTETEIKQALEKAGAKKPILRDKKFL
uniref:SPOR domain-containing protein n=1 Tax=Fundidesulfovibrio putealis TaxID=270496 RepID=A0A7C4AGN3_9BACT